MKKNFYNVAEFLNRRLVIREGKNGVVIWLDGEWILDASLIKRTGMFSVSHNLTEFEPREFRIDGTEKLVIDV